MQRKQHLLLFLKGIFMGLSDLVPGISGGTIALITGIYEKLITAIHDCFTLAQALLLFKKKTIIKTNKKIPYLFLLLVFGGIFIAIVVGSKGILYLLEHYYTYTISFFIGLIAASAIHLLTHIKKKKKNSYVYLLLGTLLGLSFLFFTPTITTPSLFYLFISGFLAINALFLPGISGSFILLLLGVYEYMLEHIHTFFSKPLPVLSFLAGAVLGTYTIARILRYLFKKHKNNTLYLLIGLLIGSLSTPIKNMLQAGIPNYFIVILFIFLGFITILIIPQQK